MTSQPLCANLIERYLCTRGSRFFRGRHDREYFYVANVRPRLHIHLEVSPAHQDVVIIRVAPGCFFDAADRARLTLFCDQWNEEDREVIAIVQESSDPQRVGVVARRTQWIRRNVSFDEFASFVDRTIADAIELFGELASVVEWPLTAQPLLRDAG